MKKHRITLLIVLSLISLLTLTIKTQAQGQLNSSAVNCGVSYDSSLNEGVSIDPLNNSNNILNEETNNEVSFSSESIVFSSSSSNLTSVNIQSNSEIIIFRLDLNGNGVIESFEVLPAYAAFVLTPNGSSIFVYDLLADYETGVLNALDTGMDNKYPTTPKFDSATAKYNCHSYAWYSQNYEENTYWMDDPSAYYQSTGSVYIEVTSAQPGDIICYFNAGGTNLHSGVVVSVVSGSSNGVCGTANLVTVQSKWGPSGLYEHRGDQCPYPASGAVTVKYYRRANHTHDFDYSSCNITGRHKKSCTDCGVTIWQQHSYAAVTDYDSNTHHWRQCVCGDYYSQEHTFFYTESDSTSHTKVCADCFVEYTEDHFVTLSSSVNNGTTHTITCECGETVTASHSYDDHYVSINVQQHKEYCICGIATVDGHTLTYSVKNGYYHYYHCQDCDYSVERTHTFTYTYINTSSCRVTCTLCGFTEIRAHSAKTILDNGQAGYHVAECGCGYEYNEPHKRIENDSTTHTGECYICDHLSDENEPHTFVYSNNGDGTHTVSCTGCYYTAVEAHTLWYGETILEYHEVYCGHCSYFEEQDHAWDDAYDEEGDHYNYCMQCGYITYYMPMSIEAFAALPEEVQKALAEAVGSQTEDFMMYIDAEQGVLCYNGTLYLFDIPNDVAVTSYLQPIPVSEDLLQILPPLPELQ